MHVTRHSDLLNHTYCLLNNIIISEENHLKWEKIMLKLYLKKMISNYILRPFKAYFVRNKYYKSISITTINKSLNLYFRWTTRYRSTTSLSHVYIIDVNKIVHFASILHKSDRSPHSLLHLLIATRLTYFHPTSTICFWQTSTGTTVKLSILFPATDHKYQKIGQKNVRIKKKETYICRWW